MWAGCSSRCRHRCIAGKGRISLRAWQVAGDEHGTVLVSLCDDLEEMVGFLARERQVAELVDDQQLGRLIRDPHLGRTSSFCVSDVRVRWIAKPIVALLAESISLK